MIFEKEYLKNVSVLVYDIDYKVLIRVQRSSLEHTMTLILILLKDACENTRRFSQLCANHC